MNAAPAWLSYVSPAIALIALCLSLATFRRAGPRVISLLTLPELPARNGRSMPDYAQQLIDDKYTITIRVYNRGLAAIDVSGLYASLQLPGYTIRVFQFTKADVADGEELPYRLEGGSSREWTLSLARPLKRLVDSKIIPKPRISWILRPHIPGPMSLTRFGMVAVALGNGNEQHATVSLWRMMKLYFLYIQLLLAK